MLKKDNDMKKNGIGRGVIRMELYEKLDPEIFEYIKGRNIIVILNKTDMGMSADVKSFANTLKIDEACFVCTATPKDGKVLGIEALEKKITDMFMAGGISKDDVFISNDRQKNALINAKSIAEGMNESLLSGMPVDMLYVDLEDIVSALGEVTGVTVQDEIIDRVFERFCVGK